MRSKSNLKYIARKGSELDLDDLTESRRTLRLRNIIASFDKLMFKNPAKSLGVLIILFALPLSLYLTLRSESVVLTSEAESSKLTLSTSQITELTPNKAFEYNFEVEGIGLKDLEFVEIESPSWFKKGNEVEQTGGVEGRKIYKLITYTGKADFDISERFVILAKGTKTSSVSECNGCDKDSGNLYTLSEFNLNTSSCGSSPVWGRNPVGSTSDRDVNSHCQKFDNECLVPFSWKSFKSSDECISAMSYPQLTKFIDDKIFQFDIDCDGSVKNQLPRIDETINAHDQDGDIVRFTVNSERDFINVKQDTIETIVKQVSGQKGNSYSDYTYTAVIEGKVTTEFIGKTSSVDVNACDMLGNCEKRSFDISAVKRGICQFTLPLTGEITDVNISNPEDGDEFSGLDNIVLSLTGSNVFDIKVDLYNQNCQEPADFISNIATYYKFRLSEDDQNIGSRGLVVSFDSRVHSDNSYCIKVFARDASIDSSSSNWEDHSSVGFHIRNNNQSPSIISLLPDTSLTTGESFEYTIEAADPDGDQINYDVIGYPSWLNFTGRTIAGSTAIPGTYNFVVFVDDNHGGFDTQQVTINVSPPTNQLSEIRFVFPIANSVLTGEDNVIRWEASDSEGISQIQLYYSTDGEQWHLIGTFPVDASETNWDVSSLENGQYYLRLVVTDNSAQQVETSIVSESFYIANPSADSTDSTGSLQAGSTPEDGEAGQDGDVAGEDTSMPAINNLTPEPDTEINSKKPLISASLHPSNDAEIETSEIEVFLDDQKLGAVCEISETEVMCKIEEDLGLGRHKVRIDIKDSKEKSMTEEWYFTIIESVEDSTDQDISDEDGSSVDDDYILIPVIDMKISKSALAVSSALCLAAFLLILIPWMIYFIWSKRSGKGDDDYTSEPVQQAPQAPIVPISEASTEFYTPQGYPGYTPLPQTQPQPIQPGTSNVSDGQENPQSDIASESMPHGFTQKPPSEY